MGYGIMQAGMSAGGYSEVLLGCGGFKGFGISDLAPGCCGFVEAAKEGEEQAAPKEQAGA